jgi:hypothetical protein
MAAEARRDLVAAAGGEDRIPAFCAAVLGGPPPTPSHPAGKSPTKPAPTTAKKG